VALGKMMNAGQICLAPDYLLVAKEQEEEMIESVVASVKSMYPTLLGNDDYTSVVNGRNYERLQGYLERRESQGGRTDRGQSGDEDFKASNGNKMPLTIVRNVNDDMKVMQEEIFGPILPVMTYSDGRGDRLCERA
jgi:coniferyl-aldehyde dehydrogenase